MNLLTAINPLDEVIGEYTFWQAHSGEGLLHRGVSAFIFTDAGKLLIQQRSRSKNLWPTYWSNSCCGHPRPDETYRECAKRRAYEELGLSVQLTHSFRYSYQSNFREVGSENEICEVYTGQTALTPKPNPHEIMAWRAVSEAELDFELCNKPEIFTPWFKLAWKLLLEQSK